MEYAPYRGAITLVELDMLSGTMEAFYGSIFCMLELYSPDLMNITIIYLYVRYFEVDYCTY